MNEGTGNSLFLTSPYVMFLTPLTSKQENLIEVGESLGWGTITEGDKRGAISPTAEPTDKGERKRKTGRIAYGR